MRSQMVDQAVRAGDRLQRRWANVVRDAIDAVSATESFQQLLHQQACRQAYEDGRAQAARNAAHALRRAEDRRNRERDEDQDDNRDEHQGEHDGDENSLVQRYHPYPSDSSGEGNTPETQLLEEFQADTDGGHPPNLPQEQEPLRQQGLGRLIEVATELHERWTEIPGNPMNYVSTAELFRALKAAKRVLEVQTRQEREELSQAEQARDTMKISKSTEDFQDLLAAQVLREERLQVKALQNDAAWGTYRVCHAQACCRAADEDDNHGGSSSSGAHQGEETDPGMQHDDEVSMMQKSSQQEQQVHDSNEEEEEGGIAQGDERDESEACGPEFGQEAPPTAEEMAAFCAPYFQQLGFTRGSPIDIDAVLDTRGTLEVTSPPDEILRPLPRPLESAAQLEERFRAQLLDLVTQVASQFVQRGDTLSQAHIETFRAVRLLLACRARREAGQESTTATATAQVRAAEEREEDSNSTGP
jgi:hypothetical protein